MGRILIYVDAENVSKEQLMEAMKDAKAFASNDDCIVGKFYGVKDILGSLVSEYAELGLEFVDTSIFLEHRRKNLTDMKLIVDCMYDIYAVHRETIKAVYVLSNDCDFTPMLYKLNAETFVIKTTIKDVFAEITSVDSLFKYLSSIEFLPVNTNNATSILFDSIYEVTRDVDASEDIIMRFIKSRMRKLEYAIKKKYGFTFGEITEQYAKKFSFYVFDSFMAINGADNSFENFKLYTTKMFGSALCHSQIIEILKGGGGI